MFQHLVLLAAGLLLSPFITAGCGHESAATQQVRSAAAVDLSCDESVIEFVEDAPMEKRVTGCGRTLTYMYKCNPTAGGGQDCRWKAVPDERDE
jgi:hypothetical protein